MHHPYSSRTLAVVQFADCLRRNVLPLCIGGVVATSLAAVFLLMPGRMPGVGAMMADAPPKSVKVATGSTLTLQLPDAMDGATFEEHLVKPADLPGTGTLEGDRYTFRPAAPMTLGAVHTFMVTAGARTKDGRPLLKDRAYTFVVAGDPVATARMPVPDQTDVPLDATITVTFDRPMAPLTAVHLRETTAGSTVPFSITPPVPGLWKWVSTTTAEFTPQTGLFPGTRYSISVPRGTASLFGDKTTQDFSWSFQTLRPHIQQMDPTDGYPLSGPTTQIVLHWNMPVDLASLKSHMTLMIEGQTQERSIGSVVYGMREEGGRNVRDDLTTVVMPAAPFAFKTTYTVTVRAGVQSTHGNLGLESDYVSRFTTVGDFLVRSSADQYGGVTMNFSNPLPEGQDIKAFIAMSPEPSGWKEEGMQIIPQMWDNNRTVNFYPVLAPSTTYTLTVSQQLRDAFGQSLQAPYATTFTTPALPPEVMVPGKGEFGIFELGKPPVFYVNSVNVSRLDMELAEVPLAEFLAMRRAQEQNYQYAPAIENLPNYRSWKLTPKPGLNLWRNQAVEIEQELKATPHAGLYVMRVRAPEWKQEWDNQPQQFLQYFWLTNTALTLKFSGHEALVWATDLTTGNPVSGASIEFHTLRGDVVYSGTTDKDGFFTTPMDLRKLQAQNTWDPEFWVVAKKGGDVSLVASNWRQGMSAYDFGLTENFRTSDTAAIEVDTYLTTDRPVYRAGDTISFKLVTRVRDTAGNMLLPGSDRSILVTVTDPKSTEIYRKEMKFSEFGSGNGELKLDPDGALGDYILQARMLPESDTNGDYDSIAIPVLAYRKLEYKVTVTGSQGEYLAGDTIEATIEGAYYFGAPLSGAKVEWRAYTQNYYFNKFTDGWYSFGEEQEWCWWNCPPVEDLLSQGSGTLGADGKLHIRVPVTLEQKKLSQAVTIEANVSDPNNQVVSNRETFPVHKAGLYLGVKTEDYVVEPGKEASIAVVAVDTEGEPLPGKKVTLSLFTRTWNAIRTKGVDGQYTYDNTVEDTFVRSVSVTTDDAGRGKGKLLVPSGGQYVIKAEAGDSGGRTALATTSVYAWSDTYVNWPHTNADRIDVIADKPQYEVGDTAKLLVKSPFQGPGVKALVTVEREGILSRSVIDITSNAQPIEVPIIEDFLPNAYVSVVIVKPRMGETFDDQGKDTGTPAFKIGTANLRVNTAARKLTLSVETNKERYLPGEKVDVTFTAKDHAGKPVRAELSLAAVDMSVLALMGFTMPDPVSYFWSERGLGVRTSHMLLYLLDRFKPGSKGGGGGDLERELRGDFKDTAYWNPSIITDSNGKASVSFTLPDNLTTWHLLAEANTKDSHFAAMAHTVISTKRVIVRPVRPRFALKDDEVELGAIVHNFLPGQTDYLVTLSGSGFIARGSLEKTVRIAEDGQEKLSFPVTITSTDSATFRFTARTHSATDERGLPYLDAIEETIPVTLMAVPQTVATSGDIDSTVTEMVYVPSEKDAGHVSLTANLSPTLATYLPGGLNYLVNFPYGCAEQTASSFLPNIAVSRLQGFEVFQVTDDATLKKNITGGIERLATFQRSDGGFGYWTGSTESYAYLSAYILFTLEQARSVGYSVDADMIARTRQYLTTVLRAQKLDLPLDLATRAYILYVLGEGGTVDRSLLQNLYEKRKELPLFGKAYLALALTGGGRASTVDNRAKTVLDDILSSAKVDPRGMHFEEKNSYEWTPLMHTNIRTTATVLQAMLRLQPSHPEIPNIVKWLLRSRESDHWDTTQSTTTTILALVDFLEQTKELDADFTATVTVNGKDLPSHTFTKKNVLTEVRQEVAQSLLKRADMNTVQLTKDGKGHLYYDVVLRYLWTRPDIPPAEEGISVRRDIVPVLGKNPGFGVGQTYKVTITITAPEERHFVAVESPHIAGWEGIDFRFATSQQGLDDEVNQTEEQKRGWWWDDPLRYFTHKEFRDDQVFLFAEKLPAGVYRYEYLVRATTPGKFQLRPARAYEMYFPEVFGQTGGEWVTIHER